MPQGFISAQTEPQRGIATSHFLHGRVAAVAAYRRCLPSLLTVAAYRPDNVAVAALDADGVRIGASAGARAAPWRPMARTRAGELESHARTLPVPSCARLSRGRVA